MGVIVAVDDSDFQQSIDEQTAKRREVNHRDHGNEMAGRSTGRMYRFHPHHTPDGPYPQDKHTLNHTTLKLLLQDPEYAKLYNDTMDLLSRAEAATEKALAQAEQDLAKAEDTLDDMRDNANKLPDGTAVFRDKDGNVWTEDGELVDPADAAGIVWKDDAPSYEDYQRQRQKADDTRQRIDDIRRYQVDVLGRARDRMSDKNNPPSKDDIQDIHDDIIEQADYSVKREIQPENVESPVEEPSMIDTAKPQM